ncbi:DUF4365 domain-containing protein [Lentzea aerocolonigenes]|uniref:DUF4365 domain-containing protein n=1 Tax=Lentzea aerocolonigenes TaxID=68170 RepID=UPI000B30E3DF|nr:DUF4365 domain-containing protein [Lentzea aerocolonigenes]MCP2249463.1 Protein of unknown function C-terminus (DUF2399) [Lentzea aerocolonigenes]
MGPASDRVGRSGVHGVASIVLDGLGWKFREHHESDWGVDAIIEIADNDQPTGRLIALQIKAGDARTADLRRAGHWTLYGHKHHLARWLEYSIPVLIVLYDRTRKTAHWQHVNDKTAVWTPRGFKIDIPDGQRLDASAAETIRAITDRWVPHRGSQRSRALQTIAMCGVAGVPVLPTEQLWQLFMGEAANPSRSGASAVRTYRLPLTGDAPAVASVNESPESAVTLDMDKLRGIWSVPADTTVYVCENGMVLDTAVAQLGANCQPIVLLNGFPTLAVEYLLIGLGACGARLRVHVDHDSTGHRIADSLFMRSVRFEQWCPHGLVGNARFEEDCLPQMLGELAD